MKKKQYEKPSSEVVELRQTGMIMTSPGQAGTENYNWNNEEEE